jgi:hypothetical protein
LACKTDRIDAWVLAESSRRDLVPAIWLPAVGRRAERERARWRLFLVRKRSALEQRIHALPSATLARSATRSAPEGASYSGAWTSPSPGAAGWRRRFR